MAIIDADHLTNNNDMEAFREAGRKDRSRLGLPSSNAPAPVGGAQELIAKTKTGLAGKLKLWSELHRHHLDEVADIQRQLDQYGPREQHAQDNLEAQTALLAAGGNAWGRSPIEQARREAKQASGLYYRLKASEGGRELNAHLSPWVYLLVMAIFSFLEFPINLEAASAIFPEVPALAFVLAAVVGILLIAYAHTTGRLTKQRTVLGLGRGPSIIIWLIAGLLSLGSIATIYFLRWRLMSLNFQQDHGELLFFLFLNISVFFFGFITSIMHYDRNPLFQSAHRVWTKAERKLKREEEKLRDSKLETNQGYHAHRNSQFLSMEQLKGDLAKAEFERSQSYDEWQIYLREAVRLLESRLTVYAQGNQEADIGAVLPKWLTQSGIGDIIKNIYDTFNEEAKKCA